jgi:hypothetical protein
MRSNVISGCAGGLIALAGMAILGVGRVQPGQGQAQGDSMVFKDSAGRPRVIIGADPDPAIFLTDAKGNRLLTLAVVGDTPLVKLGNAYDAKTVRLEMEGKGGGYLLVDDAMKRERIRVGGSDDFYQFCIKDPSKNRAFSADLAKDCPPTLQISDWRKGRKSWEASMLPVPDRN